MAFVDIPYSPRPWQRELHGLLKRFSVVVVHRGGGKTYLAINELLRQATMVNKDWPIVCAYIAPTYKQAKMITWDLFKRFFGCIPGIEFNSNDLKITLPTGQVVYVLGADNPDSLRGMHLDYVVLDEVSEMPSNIWDEVIRPMLTQKKGGALFIGTPKGQNLFHTLFVRAKDPKLAQEWLSIKRTYTDTGAISEDELESLKVEYEGRPEIFDQEYNCSFEAQLTGAYFTEQFRFLEDKGYIGRNPYEAGVDVVTGWDLGLDGTAIWYAQVVGQRINIIDFDFYTGHDIRTGINLLKGKPYIYRCHYLPHDAVKTSAADDRKEFSVQGQLTSAGYRTVVVPKETVDNRVLAAKALLPKCNFDIDATTLVHPKKRSILIGLPSLRMYKPKISRTTGLATGEDHDDHSHPASAFCYLALGLMGRNKDYRDAFHSNASRKQVRINTNYKWI